MESISIFAETMKKTSGKMNLSNYVSNVQNQNGNQGQQTLMLCTCATSLAR